MVDTCYITGKYHKAWATTTHFYQLECVDCGSYRKVSEIITRLTQRIAELETKMEILENRLRDHLNGICPL